MLRVDLNWWIETWIHGTRTKRHLKQRETENLYLNLANVTKKGRLGKLGTSGLQLPKGRDDSFCQRIKCN